MASKGRSFRGPGSRPAWRIRRPGGRGPQSSACFSSLGLSHAILAPPPGRSPGFAVMGSRSYGGEHGESLRGRRPCRQRHNVSPTKGSCFSSLELSAATCCGAAEVMIDLSVSSSGFCFHRDADRSWRVILRLAFRKTRESKHSCFGTHAYGTIYMESRSISRVLLFWLRDPLPYSASVLGRTSKSNGGSALISTTIQILSLLTLSS